MNAKNVSLIALRLYGAVSVVSGLIGMVLCVALLLLSLVTTGAVRDLFVSVVAYTACFAPFSVLAGIGLIKFAPSMVEFALRPFGLTNPPSG